MSLYTEKTLAWQVAIEVIYTTNRTPSIAEKIQKALILTVIEVKNNETQSSKLTAVPSFQPTVQFLNISKEHYNLRIGEAKAFFKAPNQEFFAF